LSFALKTALFSNDTLLDTKQHRYIASIIVLSLSQHSGNLIGFERQIRDFVKNILLNLYLRHLQYFSLIICLKYFVLFKQFEDKSTIQNHSDA
jgi:hypothetical protein